MLLRKRRKSQNLSEYAILLGVVIGALLLSQDMVKKSLVGKVFQAKRALDDVEGAVGGEGGVYLRPTAANDGVPQEEITTTTDFNRHEQVGPGMGVKYGAEYTVRNTVHRSKD